MTTHAQSGAMTGAPVGSQEKKESGKKGSVLKRVRKKFRVFSVRSGLDLPFFFLILVLLTIGLVMMFSASYPYAYYNMDGDSYYFIRNQAFYAVLGVAAFVVAFLVAAVIVCVTDYPKYRAKQAKALAEAQNSVQDGVSGKGPQDRADEEKQ